MKYTIVADESVDFRIVSKLREQSVEVYAIIESSPSIIDEDLLKIAHDNNALLLTEDKDFGELVFRLQLPHHGILLIRIDDNKIKIEKVVELIIKNLDDLSGKFSVIKNEKLRIK